MPRHESTTDLNVIRKKPKRFAWGDVIKIHDIGSRYTLVEHRHPEDGLTFHVYVDGEDCSTSAETLEKGLLLAIAFASVGYGSAGSMACAAGRVLKLE